MKFRNATEDTLDVNALGFSVAPGELTPDLDDEQAAGLVLQTDRWHAVGNDARKEQATAIKETTTTDQGAAE